MDTLHNGFAHQALILLKASNVLPVIIPHKKISKVFLFKLTFRRSEINRHLQRLKCSVKVTVTTATIALSSSSLTVEMCPAPNQHFVSTQ